MPNRLPPIIEFKSPTRHRTPSPANPGARFKYYTQPGKPTSSKSANEVVESIPLLTLEKSSIAKPGPSKLGLNGKIAPTACKSPINKTNMATGKPVTTSLITAVGTPPKARVLSAGTQQSAVASTSGVGPASSSSSRIGNGNKSSYIDSNGNNHGNNNNSSSSNHNIKQDEKYDNKKNETIERKKKEEKHKIKAEKDARKEEKRIAKEEEKLAKMLAKEEKKRFKQEAKESLLANEGGSRK